MKKTSNSSIIMKLVGIAMTCLFATWSYYQINDPDALRWILVYGIVAVLSVLFVANKLPYKLPLVVGSICLVWAAYLAMQITYESPLIAIEEWREMIGLLVAALWMGSLAWIGHRTKKLKQTPLEVS